MTRASESAQLSAAEAALEEFDPAALSEPEADAADLARIGRAAKAVEQARASLSEAVADARAGGRSWGQIGMVLGVSKQAARERFGTPRPRSATD